MSEIDELQRRLAVAMDRIGQGIGAIGEPRPAPGADANALEDMRKALAEARAARTGLETRLAELSAEVDRLRQTNENLLELSQALRAANEARLGDAELIDRTMAAELESLRAAQAVSEAEARAILDALAPLLAETPKETA
ncbi:hypothetical protein OB2597_01302 [Pseudooceanicola batsensis HTCC2597]|uniref:Uncharacterized protein n=1 Tax=Pseudooceanicola batsensis (strain ATCC BAA-863 / DSM 15984 / KCTC 12145 / HTCC2597) TaxID=252305 RepID=A3U2V3_PSEBH|nr:hypothetical protein [Pseudooceanicola batsensis]EAQ01483.1 hypothetical protein OB2597_01302 [Pseudooceanicola batsensis HTCC2597]